MSIEELFERQREFQRFVDFPIDSVRESDRNELSEKYIFKLIEEAIELRKEFPSVANPWSKKQKAADLDRIHEEFSDVLMFAINIALTWRITPEEILAKLAEVQDNNFANVKQKKLNQLNSEIKSIPGYTTVLGFGNPNATVVHVWPSANQLLKTTWPRDPDSYYTCIVKCELDTDRQPTAEEMDFWNPSFMSELAILSVGTKDFRIETHEND